MRRLPRTETTNQHAAQSVTAAKIKGLLFGVFTSCGQLNCNQIQDKDKAVNLNTAETRVVVKQHGSHSSKKVAATLRFPHLSTFTPRAW